jgi:predicted Zn-dependent protease
MKTLWILRGPVAAVVLMASLSGCSINPATGQRQVSLIREGTEIQMGREADPEIIASMGLSPDMVVQQYVSQLGKRLSAASERPDLPWIFRVVDDPTVNAFAGPQSPLHKIRSRYVGSCLASPNAPRRGHPRRRLERTGRIRRLVT